MAKKADAGTGIVEVGEVDIVDGEPEVIGDDLIVEFSSPYKFEGNEYESIDLRRLRNMGGRDMIEVDKMLSRNGIISIIPENSMGYALYMAARAARLSYEFFEGLPVNECMKVKNAVMGFLSR